MDILNGFGAQTTGALFAVSALEKALSEVERRKAELRARGVFGVLSVENKLRLEQEP
jgi:hypothetical protein